MFIDVALPSENEKEFVKQAKKLGCDGLIFLYSKDDKKNLETVKKLNSPKFKVYSGILNKLKGKYDLIFSTGAREHFENKNVDVIFSLEKKMHKDKPHYRSAGLNQVLCALANEKKIMMGVNFNDVLLAKDCELILGRMKQNVKLYKKYKNKLMIASFAKKPSELRFWSDLTSFGIVLGLNEKQAKDAVLNRKV